jgi:tetratricopeptide (TPR) repeat protein
VKGELDLAWEAARRAVAEDPSDALLHNTLGLVELARKDLGAARAEFEETLRLEPRYAGAHANLAAVLVELDHDPSEARALLERGLELDPADPLMHTSMSAFLERAGDLPGAIASARRACDVDASAAPCWALLGRLELKARDLPAAENALRRGLEQTSDADRSDGRGFVWHLPRGLASTSPEAPVEACMHADLALVLQETARGAEAAEHFERAGEIAGNRAYPKVALGRYYLQCGDQRAAEAAFRSAIELDAGNVLALGHLGTMLVTMGRAPEALPLLRSAAERGPDRADIWMNLGVACHFTGDHVAAVDAYTHALDLGSRRAVVLNNAGLCLIEVERFEDSRALLAEALVLRPNEAEYHDNLGVALWKLGRLDGVGRGASPSGRARPAALQRAHHSTPTACGRRASGARCARNGALDHGPLPTSSADGRISPNSCSTRGATRRSAILRSPCKRRRECSSSAAKKAPIAGAPRSSPARERRTRGRGRHARARTLAARRGCRGKRAGPRRADRGMARDDRAVTIFGDALVFCS